MIRVVLGVEIIALPPFWWKNQVSDIDSYFLHPFLLSGSIAVCKVATWSHMESWQEKEEPK